MLKLSSFNIEKIKKKIGRSDRLAFRELFNNYYPRLLNYSFVIIKNHESSEDIVLEVLHSIWEKRDKLKWIERFETYLYVCTKNKTLDQIRKNSKFLNPIQGLFKMPNEGLYSLKALRIPTKGI